MKKYFATLFCSFLLMAVLATSSLAQVAFVESSNVLVTCNKTTHLIFPYAIKSIDRGSQDVLAQKAPGSDNVLQLKAGKAGFPETTVTVITADNKLYPFKINYSLSPEHLTISFNNPSGATSFANASLYPVGTNKDNSIPDAGALQTTMQQVAGSKKIMYSIGTEHGLMGIQLKGMYIKNDVLYFQFIISNKSNISFNMQNISFSIKDARKAKRKALQENTLQPLLTYGMEGALKSHSKQVWVVALPKFTLEDGKYLSIQILEENGGRSLALKILNRNILTAKEL